MHLFFLFLSRYVIQTLLLLLVSFSDHVVAVREAAECAARSMMSQLSAQGVKLVLPSILKAPFVDLIVTYSAHLFDKIQ